ncbi:MAG TPA: hypothetical protein VJ787_08760, partial [Thermoleophilia bacterium]|nr:hypothetical protein [Thermoleophilia bacterium]
MGRRYLAATGAALLLLLALASPAWAAKENAAPLGTAGVAKVEPGVEAALSAFPGEAVPVIVYAPGHVNTLAVGLSARAGIHRLDLVKAVAVRLTAEQVAAIAELP